ncbi:hypothetical protein [Bradyrhizobium sp. CCBAU 51753]|nr:hypothetical protein [Bradyrhizobium sp. CCBAU 51753]
MDCAIPETQRFGNLAERRRDAAPQTADLITVSGQIIDMFV